MANLQSNLQRIPRIHNPKYKRDGLKSYGFALLKYKISPTKEGPFFMANVAHHQGKFQTLKAKIGGKTTMQHVLHKRQAATTAPSSGSGTTSSSTSTSGSGKVTAQDIQNDSEYLCPVAIGTPAQTLNLDFDTGSSDLWIWSTELPSSVTSKFGKSHTLFNPKNSSTFTVKTGSSWTIAYGDNSTASGSVGNDNVVLGGLTIKGQAIELAEKLSAQFEQGAGDGLLGLAWPSINTVTPTPVATPTANLISQDDIPKTAELFTAYLGSYKDTADPDKGESFYTFGYIDQPTLQAAGVSEADIYYTPVDNSQGFWEFNSSGASINGQMTAAPSGNTAIADTGTTLALMSDAVVEAVYAAIPGATFDSSQQGYIFPSTVTADQLPVVQVDVGGKLFTIMKEDLAFADAGNGMTYGGIQSRGSQNLDILGDIFLKGVYAVFDVGNQQFGAVQRVEATQNGPKYRFIPRHHHDHPKCSCGHDKGSCMHHHFHHHDKPEQPA